MTVAKASVSVMGMQRQSPSPNCNVEGRFNDQSCLEQPQYIFPPLKSFPKNVSNVDTGRELFQGYYREQQHRPVPGRCYCLQFQDEKVNILYGYFEGFASPADLVTYRSIQLSQVANRKTSVNCGFTRR
jgi:hypothetical protein